MTCFRKYARVVFIVAIVLSIPGCPGCVPTLNDVQWTEFQRQILVQGYLQGCGPRVMASAVGATAPPCGHGSITLLSTEVAYRQYCQDGFDHFFVDQKVEVVSSASLAGAASVPSGCVWLSLAATAGAQKEPARRIWSTRLPSLFETNDPWGQFAVSRKAG
jgi:hypothetical protein